MLYSSNSLAISSTPTSVNQQPIYGDTLGVDQFWQKLKEHCGKTYEGSITSGATANDGFGWN